MASAFMYAAHRENTCRECGGKFRAKKPTAEFCGLKCTNAYNNRRMRRGMLLYDFFMQMRYRRTSARGLWSIMCRLAEEWREEDKRHREGFKSWRDPNAHVDRNPYLKAKKGRI